MKKKNRRKCHAARRRANRLKRQNAMAKTVGSFDPADAYEAGRKAYASCAAGCLMATAAAIALLVWAFM